MRKEHTTSRFLGAVSGTNMPPPLSPLNSDPIASLPASNPYKAKYRKIAPLSSGSFGFVILYATGTNEQIAIKFLERGENITKYVEGEIINHRILRHPHVIEFKVLGMEPVICMSPHARATVCCRGSTGISLCSPKSGGFFNT